VIKTDERRSVPQIRLAQHFVVSRRRTCSGLRTGENKILLKMFKNCPIFCSVCFLSNPTVRTKTCFSLVALRVSRWMILSSGSKTIKHATADRDLISTRVVMVGVIETSYISKKSFKKIR